MRVRVDEADGPVLDWMVSVARGIEMDVATVCHAAGGYAYCIDRNITGELQELELIGVEPAERFEKRGLWIAKIRGEHPQLGHSPMVAICRSYVTSKLGGEIDVPKEIFDIEEARMKFMRQRH